MSVNVTIVGNLTADPKYMTTRSGKGYALFTTAETTRGREGEEDRTVFWRCKAWDGKVGLAKKIAETLRKGQRVILTGVVESYQEKVYVDDADNPDDVKEVSRDVLQVTVFSIGPDLTFQDVTVTRSKREDEQEAPRRKRKGGSKPKAEPKDGDFGDDDEEF